MAAHIRQQIRAAVAARITGLTTTAGRVYQTRLFDFSQAQNMPGWTVYTPSEQSARSGLDETLDRVVEVTLIGYARGIDSTALENALDEMAKEAEVAMAGAPRLGGLAHDSWLASTNTDFDAEGDNPVGAVTLTYQVLTRTTRAAPDVAT